MRRSVQKYFSAVMAVTLLLTMSACSDRQSPAEDIKSSSEPISTSVGEPPAADVPGMVSESDPTQDNVQTPEEKPVGTEFEIDTVKFKLALPEGWTAKGNEIYADDVKIAELLPFVPNGDGRAFEVLDEQYANAEVVKACTANNYTGRYYHMQSEVSEGGITALKNELQYYIDIGDKLLHFAFYPLFGTGIGTQRETFEAVLNTIGFYP